MYSGKIAVPPGGGGIVTSRTEILLLGSVRESIMTPSKTSSEKKYLTNWKDLKSEVKVI
jgi:hypothetical protein